MKEKKGITLIALVITVIIILIIAGISISMLTGDNSIISKAQEAKEKTIGNQAEEEVKIEILGSYKKDGTLDKETLVTNLEKIGASVSADEFPINFEYKDKQYEITSDGKLKNKAGNLADGSWNEEKGVNTPKIVDGLIPVTFKNDGTITELSSNDYSEWYDYSNKKWANAITKDKNGKITGYWVWIPRYEYKINSENQTFTVKFIPITQTTEDSGYNHIHPAFRNGSTTHFMNGEWDSELPGFWVAKFPAGFQKNTITDTNGTLSTDISNSSDTIVLSNQKYTSVYGGSVNMALGTIDADTKMSLPVFLPLTYAYNCISVGDIYTLAQEVSKSSDFYGLSNNTYSHMLKNSEWGAITYLAHSQYGRNGTELNINNYCTMYQEEPYKDAVTGIYADGVDDWGTDVLGNAWYTSTGQLGSSTGNMTGVYDLNGCVNERIAGYIPNGSFSLISNVGALNWLITTTNENAYLTNSTKYYTVYPFNASNDTCLENWNKYSSLQSATYGYGDAMLEITTTVQEDGNNTWYDAVAAYMDTYFSFIERGGVFTIGPYSGSFSYGQGLGYGDEAYGFRVVLCP